MNRRQMPNNPVLIANASKKVPFDIEPFTPQRGLTGPNAQTISGFLLRHNRGVSFERIRLETPDEDFIDIDFPYVQGYGWLWSQLGAESPLVLVLHGLEGSARGSLAVEIYRQLARRGIRAVGLNFRSCSGEMNRTHLMYHSGATFDVAFLLAWLDQTYPNVPKGLIGFSLGANVTLKYMGTDARFVETAVAISPPFDLGLGASILDSHGQFYMRGMLRSLKHKARLKQKELAPLVDVERILTAKTFREFDNAWQPINGFKDADDYYRQCSSKNFLPDIDKPTLILRSIDDPFFDPQDIPYDLLKNPAIDSGITAHGGHGGFLEKARPFFPMFWAERQGARYLVSHLIGKVL